MTALTELRRVVAVAAVRLTRVGRARVAGDESAGMVARLARALRAMTLETGRAHMTRLAGRRPGVRLSAVPLPELPRVTRGWCANEVHAGCAPGAAGRHRRDRPWRHPDVAAHATLLRMAGRARSGRPLRDAAVLADEPI